MYTFRNSILVVVFNYSQCVRNKDILKTIYAPHFKHILFYSDLPTTEDTEINYLDIKRGYTTHKIFKHLYTKYKVLIEDSDGLFYTMDDNIINTNILNLYDSSKIIYYHDQHTPVDIYSKSWWNAQVGTYSGWWWNAPDHDGGKYGNIAINNLLNDTAAKKYNITRFSGKFADWFYLPKKYLTVELFEIFDLFAKYEVFLEIAIPSIIHHIEPDVSKYQSFTEEVTWYNDRQKLLNKQHVYNSLNHHHNLLLHPIKFNQNPESKDWLREFFCKEKCVIITTINSPTETILKHIENKDYDVIIVGDTKTPDSYTSLNCIYLDIPAQKKLFAELSDVLPYNHYCRKNLGYLYAIKKGYKVIYETDDDNIPYSNFDSILEYTNLQMITEQNTPWINIFKYFTNNAYIWPRGFPLSLLKNSPNYIVQPTDKKPSIINGLVENDPDVDALFRIVCNHQNDIVWEKDKRILIDNKNLCVFNTQNTFWLNPALFICLIIPSSVSFRYCDILRGIINNVILKKTNTYMMYSSPNVIQRRNEHNLLNDFKSEYEMYIHNETILDYIENGIGNDTISVKDILQQVYKNLLDNKVIKQLDMDILQRWISYF